MIGASKGELGGRQNSAPAGEIEAKFTSTIAIITLFRAACQALQFGRLSLGGDIQGWLKV